MLAKGNRVFYRWIEDTISDTPFLEALILWHRLQLASFFPIDAEVHIFFIRIIFKVGHFPCAELVNFEFDHLV